ncbi:UdgX family uracil-DNA binding protein [Pontixanthobacter sp.]|uniref:UdgX family uracil-DNA binding protein n=1 Tax=Pontixanthobacter sp. TaxID=2792078 RepID=UPI003C7A329B
MTPVQALEKGGVYTVSLPRPDDFDYWRDAARRLIQCGVAPDRVSWRERGEAMDLFAVCSDQNDDGALPAPPINPSVVKTSKRFLDCARNAALHSDEERFALLYRLLWRLQSNPRIMEDKSDDDVRRIEDLAKNVRRDSHKMHAFVRFRRVEGSDGDASDRYVAWFEPDHHIVRANAGFFKRRFANMQWSILTPRGCIHWDGTRLSESGPASRSDAPADDAMEDLWRQYFASTFNPARLKIGAMMSEMPKKYWKNMPEAALIPELIAGAQSRESRMVNAGASEFSEPVASLHDIASGIGACRQCAIGCLDTQAVPGEGRHDGAASLSKRATFMIVGEQPGDQEEKAQRPFIGPAGEVLSAHLQQAGINREDAYLTNAVKHFKYTLRGKRRIHQSPTAKEIDTCRWWLDAERRIIRPQFVLALGASAARGLLGKTVSITRARGVPLQMDDQSELWITAHPSYLLRLDGDARAEQERLFQQDLKTFAKRLESYNKNLQV